MRASFASPTNAGDCVASCETAASAQTPSMSGIRESNCCSTWTVSRFEDALKTIDSSRITSGRCGTSAALNHFGARPSDSTAPCRHVELKCRDTAGQTSSSGATISSSNPPTGVSSRRAGTTRSGRPATELSVTLRRGPGPPTDPLCRADRDDLRLRAPSSACAFVCAPAYSLSLRPITRWSGRPSRSGFVDGAYPDHHPWITIPPSMF